MFSVHLASPSAAKAHYSLFVFRSLRREPKVFPSSSFFHVRGEGGWGLGGEGITLTRTPLLLLPPLNDSLLWRSGGGLWGLSLPLALPTRADSIVEAAELDQRGGRRGDVNECMEIGGSTLPFHTLIDPSSHSSFTSNHPFPLPSPLFSSLDRLIGGREKLKKGRRRPRERKERKRSWTKMTTLTIPPEESRGKDRSAATEDWRGKEVEETS